MQNDPFNTTESFPAERVAEILDGTDTELDAPELRAENERLKEDLERVRKLAAEDATFLNQERHRLKEMVGRLREALEYIDIQTENPLGKPSYSWMCQDPATFIILRHKALSQEVL